MTDKHMIISNEFTSQPPNAGIWKLKIKLLTYKKFTKWKRQEFTR